MSGIRRTKHDVVVKLLTPQLERLTSGALQGALLQS
jgi:hypothetical protein